eukprot:86190_1
MRSLYIIGSSYPASMVPISHWLGNVFITHQLILSLSNWIGQLDITLLLVIHFVIGMDVKSFINYSIIFESMRGLFYFGKFISFSIRFKLLCNPKLLLLLTPFIVLCSASWFIMDWIVIEYFTHHTL